jgi:hypothetical protein
MVSWRRKTPFPLDRKLNILLAYSMSGDVNMLIIKKRILNFLNIAG